MLGSQFIALQFHGTCSSGKSGVHSLNEKVHHLRCGSSRVRDHLSENHLAPCPRSVRDHLPGRISGLASGKMAVASQILRWEVRMIYNENYARLGCRSLSKNGKIIWILSNSPASKDAKSCTTTSTHQSTAGTCRPLERKSWGLEQDCCSRLMPTPPDFAMPIRPHAC